MAQEKEPLHMVAEHRTPTVDVRHDGRDAVPRSDAAGTGAPAAANGTDAADTVADAADAAADAADAASGAAGA